MIHLQNLPHLHNDPDAIITTLTRFGSIGAPLTLDLSPPSWEFLPKQSPSSARDARVLTARLL